MLSNAHCLGSDISTIKSFQDAKTLIKGDAIDLALLEVPKQKNFVELAPKNYLHDGCEIYAAGFGHFKNLQQPSLYRGHVTRIVYEETEPFRPIFIQHTARTYPG